MHIFRLKSVILLFLLSFFVLVSAEGNYVSLGGYGGSDVTIKVVEQDKSHTRIEICLPGFFKETVQYEGSKEGIVISAFGMLPISSAGVPDVPCLSRIIQVPDQAVVSYNIIDKTQQVMENIHIAPSRGQMYINENKNTIPRKEGGVYKTDKNFPEELFGIASVGIMRDVRTLKYFFGAFQYNPVKSKLIVTSRIVVDFIYTEADAMNIQNGGVGAKNMIMGEQYHPSAAFKRMYKALLPNYAPAELNGYEPSYNIESNLTIEEGILFLVGNALNGQIVDDFIKYKNDLLDENEESKFYTIKLLITDEDYSEVKDIIRGYPDVTYVILIGDVEHIPTYIGIDPLHFVGPTDQDYCLLNEGLEFDVMLSRFSAKNADDLKGQFDKVKAYENPEGDTNWIKRAFYTQDSWNTNLGDVIRNNMIYHPQFDENGIIFCMRDSDNFKSKVFEAFDDTHTDPMYWTAVNMFVYSGHGIPEKLAFGDEFTLSDIAALNNTSVFPLMFLNACHAGDFTWNEGSGDCFSEAMMKAGDGTTPHGAATIFSCAVSLIYEGVHTMRPGFTNKFYNQEFRSFGEFCMVTKQSIVNWCLTIPGHVPEPVWRAIQLYYSYNLLGDCTIEMRLGSPVQDDYDWSDYGLRIKSFENGGEGPVLFTAERNAVLSDIVVEPALHISTRSTIKHDFEVLAKEQIRIVPDAGEFRAVNGSKVHLAIDDDLLIIPPPYPW